MSVIEQRRVRRLTASLATMWLLPVGLLVVMGAGFSVGAVPLAVAALLALVPVPIYLISVLALPDLLQSGRLYITRTFQPIPVYIVVALLYILMTLFLSLIIRSLEKRFKLP